VPLPDPLITASPERLGGTPVFAGTRVPVQSLFDHLAAGDPLAEFLEDFPDVTREHAVAVLKASKAARFLSLIEQQGYEASPDELAAIDEALGQLKRDERATDEQAEAAFRASANKL
jgi:uncharacterized protein (DUF433 family)